MNKLRKSALCIALIAGCNITPASSSTAPLPITPGWEPSQQELQTLQKVLALSGLGLSLEGWSLQVYRSMDHSMHPVDWSPGREDWEHWTDPFIPAGGKCVKGVIKSTPHKRLRILHMTRNDVDYHNANVGRWLKCGFQYYASYRCENLAALVIHERLHLAPYNWSHNPEQDAYFQPIVDQKLAEFVSLHGAWLAQNACDWR
jgi:hypothetical protein